MSGLKSLIRPGELTIVASLIALILLNSPLLDIWSDSSNPWYTPYLIWSLIILLIFLLQKRINNDAI